MNLPETPGQSNKGKKAAKVVAVEDVTGQNMRLAAKI